MILADQVLVSTGIEQVIQVPLIVSGPGIKPQSTVAGMAANYDLAATWAALAGATPSASVSRTNAAELRLLRPGAGL